MKTKLIPKTHGFSEGATVIEVWHDGKFIATNTGAEGPGVRIFTKNELSATPEPEDEIGVHVLLVSIGGKA